MISQEQIDAAVRVLAQVADAQRILLFGSYARGDQRRIQRNSLASLFIGGR